MTKTVPAKSPALLAFYEAAERTPLLTRSPNLAVARRIGVPQEDLHAVVELISAVNAGVIRGIATRAYAQPRSQARPGLVAGREGPRHSPHHPGPRADPLRGRIPS